MIEKQSPERAKCMCYWCVVDRLLIDKFLQVEQKTLSALHKKKKKLKTKIK